MKAIAEQNTLEINDKNESWKEEAVRVNEIGNGDNYSNKSFTEKDGIKSGSSDGYESTSVSTSEGTSEMIMEMVEAIIDNNNINDQRSSNNVNDDDENAAADKINVNLYERNKFDKTNPYQNQQQQRHNSQHEENEELSIAGKLDEWK
jgi:hypothetical protein